MRVTDPTPLKDTDPTPLPLPYKGGERLGHREVKIGAPKDENFASKDEKFCSDDIYTHKINRK